MKKIIILLILMMMLFFTSGCQVIDLEQNSFEHDIELSNTNWQRGYPFYAKGKAWYILDLGPINDASLDRIVDGGDKLPGDLYNVTITTQFTPFDTILRGIQEFYVGVSVIGPRTIIVEGQKNYLEESDY